MSHRDKNPRFWFRGNAAAFGGRLVSPICETLDVQGSAVLPPTGGFASATVGPFNHRNIVAFESATSTVSGHETDHDGATTRDTLVTATLEGLSILNMVTADRVVVRLTSRHPEKEGEEPHMLPLGSYFENLRIGGVSIAPTPRPELVEQGGYAELTGTRPSRSVDGRDEESADPRNVALGAGSTFEDRYVLMSLFDADALAQSLPGGCEVKDGHGIYVPGFGTIYLGEYLVSRHARRLTMLRVELGCPVEGTIVSGYGDGNGHLRP